MHFSTQDIQLAGRIKALGHPARLAIIRALIAAGDRQCCCGEIVSNLPLAQSTVSQHLKVLKEAGIVQGKIDGPRCAYWLDRTVLASIGEAMTGFERAAGACCQMAEAES
ncbi:ArsR/SmtB family transcription factor [Bauldia litoralis]|uniref:ArsR/SmtB family transcription factor n=1 Tax=Bauldia litoralis TaxID=665467 RepID=UPI00326694CD